MKILRQKVYSEELLSSTYFDVNLRPKKFSKQEREVVPDDIAEEGRKSGVVQKDKSGNWRIISYKTKTNKSGKPEFWDAKYESKEAAEKALGGYFANKRR